MRFTIGPAGLGYLLVSGLIAATAFYTQINLLFWALGLMIAGMIVSVIGSWLMMRKLEVSRILPDHGVAGEQTILRYRVVNHSHWIPVFGLTIKETWGRGRRGWKREGPITEDPPRLDGRPHGWLMHLGPGQVLQAQAPCWPLRRGELTFERLVLSCSFPFGVVGREASFQRPGSLLVYPHLYRVNRKLIHQISNMDPVGHQRLERGGGHEEFFGLRQYRLGDSMKMIEWKRSAKTGELVSREMTQPCPPRVMIVLDLVELPDDPVAARDAIERSMSLTASLVCDAYLQGHQIGLTLRGVTGSTIPVHHSLPHRSLLLEALARFTRPDNFGAGDPLIRDTTVIIRATGEQSRTADGSMVLSADYMHRYISDLERGAAEMLDRRVAPVRHRARDTREGAIA